MCAIFIAHPPVALSPNLVYDFPTMNTLPGQPGARIPLSGKMLLTIGIAALIIFLCLGGFLLAASLGMQNIFGEADLAVSLAYPPSVSSGDTFEVTASLRNTGQKAVTLSEVQVAKTLLEGMQVQAIDPPGGEAVDYAGRVGYSQSILIPAGQTRSLTIVFKALLPTQFSGDLRFLTGARASSASLTIEVQPAAPNSRSTGPNRFTYEPLSSHAN